MFVACSAFLGHSLLKNKEREEGARQMVWTLNGAETRGEEEGERERENVEMYYTYTHINKC